MTESEWLSSADPAAMLIHLRGELTPVEAEHRVGLHSSIGVLVPGPAQRTTPGRLRAFAAACLPRWQELPLDLPSRAAVDAYAGFLDRAGTRDAFLAACLALHEQPPDAPRPWLNSFCALWDDTPHGVGHMTWSLETSYANHVARDEIAELMRNATEDDQSAWGFCGYYDSPLWAQTVTSFLRTLPPLLRETVGNPFRPTQLDPSWLTETVAGLAGAIYERRSFCDLPVLADALEEAGCDDADILAHCRSEREHARECWVIDIFIVLK